MATTNSEVFIARGADEVWAAFGDFHGIKNWFPGLEDVRSDGDTRFITMGPGMEIAETLVSRDDAARSLSYAVSSDVLPTTKYVTTCSVDEADGGCIARMSADIEPDDIAPMIQGVYDNAVQGLASNFA
jgi:uncharacterized protein YndB with AHSA1/START domain